MINDVMKLHKKLIYKMYLQKFIFKNNLPIYRSFRTITEHFLPINSTFL